LTAAALMLRYGNLAAGLLEQLYTGKGNSGAKEGHQAGDVESDLKTRDIIRCLLAANFYFHTFHGSRFLFNKRVSLRRLTIRQN